MKKLIVGLLIVAISVFAWKKTRTIERVAKPFDGHHALIGNPPTAFKPDEKLVHDQLVGKTVFMSAPGLQYYVFFKDDSNFEAKMITPKIYGNDKGVWIVRNGQICTKSFIRPPPSEVCTYLTTNDFHDGAHIQMAELGKSGNVKVDFFVRAGNHLPSPEKL
jgi:hypothetical protein